MGPLVQISGASAAALAALSKTVSARGKYLGETASASCHAMLHTALRSLRALTRVAKTPKGTPGLKRRGDLSFGWHVEGGRRRMCLRKASGERLKGDAEMGAVRFAVPKGADAKRVQVYEFDDAREGGKGRVYLVAAPSRQEAAAWARGVVRRRVMRYAGLAKRAVSALMAKSNARGALEAAGFRVAAKAQEVTAVREGVSKSPVGGIYTLEAHDALLYAKAAVRGGASAVDVAAKRAVNKAVGMIRHRVGGGGFFEPGELPPVFADVRKRGAA